MEAIKDMTTENITDFVNPGEQLQLLLKDIYIPDPETKQTFISKVDEAFIAEGEFAQIIYDSTINYMVRRLITTADYIRRSCEENSSPDTKVITQLRKFLQKETKIPNKYIEKILSLLLECLKVRGKEVSPTAKKRIHKSAKNRGLVCYICGNELNFEEINQYNSVEIEHVWPNAMGGISEETNLGVACMHCNKTKASNIDSSDFHYEEICLVSDKSDTHFSNELSKYFKIALWAKSKFCCVRCGKPASYMGELQFGRRNSNDSWHFLNIDAYCEQHVPE